MLQNKLKSWRHKKEMNQSEFADFLGIKIAQYNRYENQKSQPEILTAFRMARKLNCYVDDLFDFE